MKLKRKLKRKRKHNPNVIHVKYEDEIYVFKNGFAEVPGVRSQGKPILISIKNFREMVEISEAKSCA